MERVTRLIKRDLTGPSREDNRSYTSSAAVLKPGVRGSIDRFQGVCELERGGGEIPISFFTNLKLNLSFSFNNECRQKRNLYPLNPKNFF